MTSVVPEAVRGRDVAQDEQGAKRALLYLRVSTPSQVNTDYDPEGLSIPAQRLACEQKAAQIGAVIVGEYVEPGRSATSMDKRPVFQQMLERVRTERDVDHIIVYELSRLNRNRIDDAWVVMSLRPLSVSLISATENIDDTPTGRLVHGMLATLNEFRSAKDGADIKYKMGEKARRGGTLGLAKLGYLNVREKFEGREVRTIALDPERAPLVLLAFELYATGEYSLERLSDVVTERGLRTRPGRRPAGPVSTSKLATMLCDRYYLGYTTYQGVERRGRHDAIVTPELFDRVQTVLEARRVSGERQRVHHHYLKGTVFCGLCHEQGREGRLIFQEAKGRGGTYQYFFCRQRQEGRCDSRYSDTELVEEAVLRHYATLRFTPEFIERVRSNVRATIDDEQRAAKIRHGQLTAQLAKLDVQEDNLLDLAADAALPQVKVRERLRRIQREREAIKESLGETNEQLAVGAALVEAALDLLADPQELYRRAGERERRLLNQAFFEKLLVYEGEVVGEVLAEPFAGIVEAERRLAGSEGDAGAENGATSGTEADLLVVSLCAEGSSRTALVELRGFEPLTS